MCSSRNKMRIQRRTAACGRSLPVPATLLPRLFIIPLILSTILFHSCQSQDPVGQEKGRTLSDDERYIVALFMKINEIEENLQDNPEESEKKWDELREEYDPERVRRIILELEEDPERWIAVHSRIVELLRRRE
jgi:hypothetical protein